MENKYLIHYRTPGSKNGVRLYQYKDGSLTPLGKLRYGSKGKDDRDDVDTRDDTHNDYKRAHSGRTSNLSDAELQNVINRLANEQRYKELTAKKPSPLAAKAKEVASSVGTDLLKTYSKKYLQKGIDWAIAEGAKKVTNKKNSK